MTRKLIGPQGKEWTVTVDRVGAGARKAGGGIPRPITHVTFTHGGEARVATTAREARSAEAFTDRELLALLERARKA